MTKTKFRLAAALLALSLAPAAAWAGPVSSPEPACTAAAVGFSYVACAGSFEGNLKGSLDDNQAEVVKQLFAQNHSSYDSAMIYSSTSAKEGDFGVFSDDGKDFSLNFDAGTKATGLFVIGLKQATRYSFYLIDGGTEGLSQINFNVNGVVSGPQSGGLSHAVYIGMKPLSMDSTPPQQIDQTVPEPQTLALLAAGLGAIAWTRRRRAR